MCGSAGPARVPSFLRYTEYGGYYEDQRIRELGAGLLDDTQP